jgi:hypothetical protein
MPETSFQVPISFHIFNRPDSTRKVFEVIRSCRPRKLFVTADGPRTDVADDEQNCAETRSIIEDVDWDCDLITRFSDKNRGSFKSTSEGISSVFQQVDRAIFLEDDCIPHPTFFRYCRELLDYYDDDERVALITGNNFLFGQHSTPYSYHFSRYTHMWGWATWKRTWEKVDFGMQGWPGFRDAAGLNRHFSRKHEVLYWKNIMQGMYEGRTGLHWDYLLLLSMFMNDSLAVKPGVNLVNNSGFGEAATHFRNKDLIHDVATEAMEFPLEHPPEVCRHTAADDYVETHVFSKGRVHFLASQLLKRLPVPATSLIRATRKKLGL